VTFRVRQEGPDDYDAIRELHRRAFAPSTEEAVLVDAVRDSGANLPGLCLVALREEAVAGHVMFSRARLDSGHPALALAPMAVLPELQGKGAGSALVREGLRRAAETDFPLVVVVGHPSYYPRFGFEPGSTYEVRAPFPVPPEAWMIHRLPAYRPEARGLVVYPEAFGLGATT
jgi:putative acetyltransferase